MTVLMYDLRLKNIPAEVWMGILVLACTILLFTSGVKNVLPASGSVEKKVILIDAGHGGDDPGKIGINQAKEKDINLAIAKKLKVCLEKAGFEVVMTREADESVKGPEQGNKKSTDMRNRCAKIRETKPAMAVSIHQNSYTSPEIQGAQVFYYGQSENGKKLAEILQTALIEQVDPDNHRAAKANESYYLLKKTPTPTVIVECGFLSNPTEAELLLQDDYQDQLVNAIYTGIKTYLGDELPQSESS